jgi:hypothetical protein
MEISTELDCAEEWVHSYEQPKTYSQDELAHLRNFIQLVQNDERRAQLACWGNHSDYSHGY